jgi:ketosteroid isomerase-like protein
MKRAFLFAAALLFWSVWAHADSAANNVAAEKQIRAALAHWVEAANRGDYKTALAVWAPDLVGWPPAGPDDSYEREAKYASMPPPSQPSTYVLKIEEVIVEGSMAVVRDIWTETDHDASGVEKVETFRSFEVWRRQPDGTWNISRWIDGPPMHAS